MDVFIDFINFVWVRSSTILHKFFVAERAEIWVNAQYALMMLAACLVVELMFVGWQRSSIKNLLAVRRSSLNDIILYTLYLTGLLHILAALATGGWPYFLAAQLRAMSNEASGLSFLGPVLHFLVVFLIIDFLDYWRHRITHQVPWLWQMHKMHHSATEFNMVSNFRSHPIERGLQLFFKTLPMPLLGVPTGEYPLLVSLLVALGLFQHSNVKWRLGWIGDYIIQSPRNHRIHHGIKPEMFDCNFAFVLPIWDHLFGTFYKGNDCADEIGVPHNDMNKSGLIHDLLMSQWRFMVDIIGFVRSLFSNKPFVSCEQKRLFEVERTGLDEVCELINSSANPSVLQNEYACPKVRGRAT